MATETTNRFVRSTPDTVTHIARETDEAWLPYALRCPATPRPERRAVLFVHGLSARSNTFEANESVTPDGPTTCTLAGYLAACADPDGGEPPDLFFLDWRGSSEPALQALVRGRIDARGDPWARKDFARQHLNFDCVAHEDCLGAVEHIVGLGYTRISVMAHCMGAAAFSQVIALNLLPEAVDRVVLSAVGLLLRLVWFRQLLGGEYQIAHDRAAFPEWVAVTGDIDGWPTVLQNLFAAWLRAGVGSMRLVRRPYEPRLEWQMQSFLFGEPYAPDAIPEMHREGMEGLFGPLSVDLLGHAAESVRAGGMVQLPYGPHESKADPDAPKLYAALDTAPVGFARLKELTLVTGHLNRLWHRQSVDRMYEWLIRDVKRCRAGDSTRPRIEKVVLRGYAHQDLLWAPTAERDVFPTLAKGLGLAEPAR